MVDGYKQWFRATLLRGAGLAPLAGCWLLMSWLLNTARLALQGHPSLVQVAAATGCFLCFSGGAALTVLGTHLFDRVEVSTRWARRPRVSFGDGREDPARKG